MPTLTGTIVDGSGVGVASTTITFDTVGDPLAVAGGVIRTRQRVTVTSESDGDFTATLAGGAWRMRWVGAGLISEVVFTMPPSGGPYALDDLVFNTTTESSAAQVYGVAGRSALRAVTGYAANQMRFLSYLVTPDDGQGGWFKFDAASTAVDDTVDVLKPNDIADASPGRWVRDVYA